MSGRGGSAGYGGREIVRNLKEKKSGSGGARGEEKGGKEAEVGGGRRGVGGTKGKRRS